MKLVILHTNDIHSRYENFAKAATILKQRKDDQTLILEGGDFADFRAIELQGTKGEAALQLLEHTGYDALTIGNNETFNGMDTLEHMTRTTRVPFISNNLSKLDRTAIEGVCPSIIVEKSRVRILITGSSPDLGGFNEGLGLHVEDYKKALRSTLDEREGQYDLCLVLSHVGTEADAEIAEAFDEVGVIISAHDHQLYAEAKVIHGSINHSAGSFAEHVGVVEVEKTSDGWQLVHSEVLPTEHAQPDPDTLHLLKQSKEVAISNLRQPLFSLEHPLWHDVVEENPLTNLIADGLFDWLDCDFAIINSGIANAGLFDFVSRKKLIEVCPSPLNPTTFEVKGEDIKQALEESLDAQVCLADGKGPGFRGKFVGSLHVAGAEVVHDGKAIQHVAIQGAPLEDDRWYTVGSSDYLHRGSGYPSLANNRNESYRPEEIKDVIEKYAQKKEFVERAHDKRVMLEGVKP
ncbi:5'-nucleotidase C-terminal domain-containing protein [Halobacillus litoralis]|uniref:bifunctional metallophosphatase/5'-nucleotidase n=1 Tax=Halobacillus litoralis TaxID=45668 RepID=UPI001CD3B97C|nr:5'-nucleotidase C-terminal domain-containing protein [Halobacillus litoralis]MCA0972481.1 5'-nucleotidase C-terminal domain-containing protein [Halobacillus litoralis]